eukprot:gene25381-34717_t
MCVIHFSRGRNKRGGATGSGNVETYNFRMGPEGAKSPKRDYAFKAQGRDVLHFEPEKCKAGKSIVKKDAPIARDAPHARAGGKRATPHGNAGTAHGMQVSVSHSPSDAAIAGSPGTGAIKHRDTSATVEHLSEGEGGSSCPPPQRR